MRHAGDVGLIQLRLAQHAVPRRARTSVTAERLQAFDVSGEADATADTYASKERAGEVKKNMRNKKCNEAEARRRGARVSSEGLTRLRRVSRSRRV